MSKKNMVDLGKVDEELFIKLVAGLLVGLRTTYRQNIKAGNDLTKAIMEFKEGLSEEYNYKVSITLAKVMAETAADVLNREIGDVGDVDESSEDSCEDDKAMSGIRYDLTGEMTFNKKSDEITEEDIEKVADNIKRDFVKKIKERLGK